MSGVFFNHYPFYLLRQGLSLSPEIINLASLASQFAPGSYLCFPSMRIASRSPQKKRTIQFDLSREIKEAERWSKGEKRGKVSSGEEITF